MTSPDLSPDPSGAATGQVPYRVLARKYRPTTFADMVGQDALVRTLTNAIASGRLAHAFILTGVRGVGKTTSARIMARALNCVGPDGTGGPTATPCGICDNCRSIADDRHVDVLEMDAASHTGVDDIREIIDGVRYTPVMGRYKVYIIDEVHMLSRNAFNALLKTLEEPPPHVIFIFATTEIRKVPVTVLSRCQRFDLRRIEADVLARHFAGIAEQESIAVEPEALALIARAADGSARDGLSLLDQAIALSGLADAQAGVTAEQVRDMLGLVDRSRVIDLFETTVRGRPAEALKILDEMHRDGADPLVVLQDLMQFTNFLARAKVVPDMALGPEIPEAERSRGQALTGQLGQPVLARCWQMLLKGLGELQAAPAPRAALEMVLLRIAYAAGLPTPDELLRMATPGGGAPDAGAGPTANPPGPQTAGSPAAQAPPPRPAEARAPRAGPGPTAQLQPSVATEPATDAASAPAPGDFRGLVELFAARKEMDLYGHLYAGAHEVRYEPGRLEVRLRDGSPRSLASDVMRLLGEWTGRRWVVSVSGAVGQPTLQEQDRAETDQAIDAARQDPLVRSLLEAFPGAEITDVRRPGDPGLTPDADETDLILDPDGADEDEDA